MIDRKEMPWRGVELKRFWAAARSRGLDKDAVYGMVASCQKQHLHELTRGEFLELLRKVSMTASTGGDQNHGWSSDKQWKRILWLQHELGWTDDHRDNYIKKLGRIDSVKFMTVDIARRAIIAFQKKLMLEVKEKAYARMPSLRPGL